MSGWRISIDLESYFHEHAGKNLDESRIADDVVEHIPTKIDSTISEGSS